MVDAVKSPYSAVQSETSSAKKENPLDREAFLKLLVAQLSHQDPLQPTEGTEYVAQLSQFALVEQSVSQSAKLEVLSAQMRGISNNEAVGLVGKTVNVRGHGVSWDGVSATGASVSLGGPANKVTVKIQDATGKTVRTMELGSRPAGAAGITWDGKDDAGNVRPAGTYQIKVEATNAEGQPVDVTQDVAGTVTKVTFDKGYPELTLDSGATAPVSDLVSVGGVVR